MGIEISHDLLIRQNNHFSKSKQNKDCDDAIVPPGAKRREFLRGQYFLNPEVDAEHYLGGEFENY